MSDDNIIHFSPWQDYNDAPQVEDPFGIEPDLAQIETFLDVVFGYCEGQIPIRGFVDMGQGKEGSRTISGSMLMRPHRPSSRPLPTGPGAKGQRSM